MPVITTDEMQRILKEKGIDCNNQQTIFPNGFKIVDFEGKNYLYPLTEDEFRNGYKQEFGEYPLDGHCDTLTVGCRSHGCTGYCELVNLPEGGFACACQD